MTIGARDLLDRFQGSQRLVAEAYVKGDIPRHLEQFIWDVICPDDVEEARNRLDRTAWRLIDRVAKLEEEVTQLKNGFKFLSATDL